MIVNGKVIPRTPIAVDFWKIRECPNARLFFLTHLHGDHTVGLTSSWQHKIYCSEITGKLLEERYKISPSLICPLETGCNHIMYVDSDQVEQMSVTVIDAHHCPGSVMFLFEGYFGKILYTGDFRFDTNMKNDPLMLNLSNTDIVYLDNTYNSPGCVFPSREECRQQVLEIIGSHPDCDIKIGLRNLGKEDLLVIIAQALQEWIKVTPIFLKVAELLDLPDVFITGETDARIEVVPFHSISNKKIERWNKQHPTIAILPTSLYTGLEMSPFCNQENVFIVPYSDHSSFNELMDFVKLIKPSCVYPIVSGKSRGPFGLDVTDRADVSVYRPHLGNPRTRNTDIPDSVKRWMCGTRTLPPAKVLKKKPLALTRKRSRQSIKKGVHFDDSTDDSTDEFSERKSKKSRTSEIEAMDDDDDGTSKSDENLQVVIGGEMVNARETERQAGTETNGREESLAISHTECVKERDLGDPGRISTESNSTGRKRQLRKTFLVYVMDTDFIDVDVTSETTSTEKDEDNRNTTTNHRCDEHLWKQRMATTTTRAQELITCDLNCDKAVQQFCNSCQVGLCADCINKHVNSLKSMKHDIVPFTKRTVQLVFPQCTSHSHQRCEAHCQQCDVPVCIKCVTGPHQGHVVVDMADIIARKKENIKREIEEIESSIIPKNVSCDADVETKISKSNAHYSDLEKEAKYKRKKWHKEVDNIFDTFESLIQSLRDQEITILKSCQSQLRSQNSSMTRTVQENKEILKSNKVSGVNSYRSKLTEFRAIPQVPDVRSPSH